MSSSLKAPQLRPPSGVLPLPSPPSHLISGHPRLPSETEIWQLWQKLRQGEPRLVGNLEGFLAKMSSHLQEARAQKEVLELNMRK